MSSFLQIFCQFFVSLEAILEPPWGCLGANVGSSWAILGSSSTILGYLRPSWAVLNHLGELNWLQEIGRKFAETWTILCWVFCQFCQFLVSLGAILGPPWGHLGANMGSSRAILGKLLNPLKFLKFQAYRNFYIDQFVYKLVWTCTFHVLPVFTHAHNSQHPSGSGPISIFLPVLSIAHGVFISSTSFKVENF